MRRKERTEAARSMRTDTKKESMGSGCGTGMSPAADGRGRRTSTKRRSQDETKDCFVKLMVPIRGVDVKF